MYVLLFINFGYWVGKAIENGCYSFFENIVKNILIWFNNIFFYR